MRKTSAIVLLFSVCLLCFCVAASDETTPIPTVSIKPINLTTMPIATHQTVITPFPTTQTIYEGPWVFSGQVLRGASWETAKPEDLAVVECYCSEDPRDVGHLVGSSVTDARGVYDITVSEECRFYTLSTTGDPATDVHSQSGTVLSGARIRYEEPLYGKNLTGNLFFYSTGESAVLATPAGSPVPAGTRFAPDTPLPVVLVILAIGAVGLCAAEREGSIEIIRIFLGFMAI